MRNSQRKTLRFLAASGLALVAGLTGCGGGGGGGGAGGNGLPGFLALSSAPLFGSRIAGSNNFQAFPTAPAGGIGSTVAAAVFTSGAPNGQDFLQFTFNVPVQASSILGSGPGTAGIVVQDALGNSLPFVLDGLGQVDPSNAFPSADTAPATLRLYYDPDPAGNLLSPNFLPPGQYVVRILSNNLRSFSGGPFCVGAGGTNCVNTLDPLISFAVGNDPTNLTLAAVTPTQPTSFSLDVSIGEEVTLNFSEAVDFPALIGAANVSGRDPFISIPFPMAYAAPASQCITTPVALPITGGNLYLNYTPFTDPSTGNFEQIPAGCASVVYMPDPILAPNVVRIRPVDQTNLVSADGATTFQNYGSNPVKFPLLSNDPAANNAILQLPPILPVPGSRDPSPLDPPGSGNHLATLDVVVMSANFLVFNPPAGVTRPIFAAGAQTCYTATGGARDRSGNALQSDFWTRISYANGPVPSRNPNITDGVLVGIQGPASPGVGFLNTTPITTNLLVNQNNTQAPVWAGTFLVGAMEFRPNRLDNQAIVGLPLDLEVGAWIDPSGSNNSANGGRGSVGTAGVPDTQNGTTPCGLVDLVFSGACPGNPPAFPPPAQPWGSYLYVADGGNELVRVLNSYDFSVVTTLIGIPFPGGLGILPNLQELYISNREQGTVTVVNTNPFSPLFHQTVTVISVGNNPRAVSAHPGGEDVFVVNFSENTFSIVDAQLQQERVSLSSGLGPTDIFITNRMLGMGLTNAYTAFITNFFSNDVTIYESDSPSVPSNGPNGNLVGLFTGLSGPSRGTWNWQTYISFVQEPGCYVVNSLGRTVDELAMFNFTLGPPPGFPGPPGRRDFHIRKSFSSFASTNVGDTGPADASIDPASGLYNFAAIGLTNSKAAADPSAGQGVPSVVLVAFPGAGRVVAYNYNSTALVGEVQVPGASYLQSYYDQ